VTQNPEKDGFDTFLTDSDETEDGVGYIKPNIELKLPAAKRNECRDIVREIKNFGVRGQRQILYLIYLLALEVEDPSTMKALVDACKEGRKDLAEEKKLIL
jgi:hypothetical protein